MPESVASAASQGCKTEAILSSDAGAPEAFALRYPAAKKSPGLSLSDAVTNRNAAIRTLDYMLKNPTAPLKLWGKIEEQIKQEEADAGGGSWNSQYKRIWRIPVEWWAWWLTKYGKDSFPPTLVAKMKDTAEKEKAIKPICYFLLGLADGVKLDPSMLPKKVAARVFEELADKMARWGEASAAVDLNTGVVDVKKLAVYEVTYNDEDLSEKIVHRSSKDSANIAKGYKWSKEFRIVSPLVDGEAMVCPPGEKKGTLLAKFFPIGTGPHKYMMDLDGEGLKDRAEKHACEIDEEIEKARAGEFCQDDALPQSAEKIQQKRKALTAARQSAKDKKQKMEQPCDE